MDTNENIVDNLKYIGLDLNKIPKKWKEYKTMDFRPSKYGDERNYKIYKYLDVNEIEILLTPTNRMCDISEKYSKAAPLIAYLEPESEKDIERNTIFLKMIENLNKKEIEEIEKEQKELNKKIPFSVKYPRNYLWQIYYSEYTNKYFMLVTTEDLDYSAFFYLLKAKLSKKTNKIFVPISYLEYSREFLGKSEIEEMEKYLCFFNKEWPQIYEIYDKDNSLSMQIVGKTLVYDNIFSNYKIKFSSKEEAQKFYTLVKALFILQTQLSHYYKFNIKLDYKGNINFYFENKKIIYEILSSFIKSEYIKADNKSKDVLKEKKEHEKEIKNLKQNSSELEQEYLEKEKQISTYLECRKTFIGRVKFFFKSKKILKGKSIKKNVKEESKNDIEIIKYGEIKEHYTLEELVNLYKEVDKIETENKGLELDIKTLKNKIENLKIKIKNATQYIEEIEKHKKSIFEFWRFTNKDKVSELTEGTVQEQVKGNLKKVFNYELDFEDLSKSLDRKQRKELSQNELNSIFVLSYFLEDINTILNKKKITKQRLEEVKKYASEETMLFNDDNFNIFGAVETNSNKLKTLANKKHRESARELFKILDINQKTTIEEYTNILKKVIEDVNNSISKISTKIELPVYMAGSKIDVLNIFSIDPNNALNKFETDDESEINLYKIKLNEDTNILATTNIVYYNNYNQTLPLGMSISDGIIINSNELKLKETNKNNFNIITYENPKNELSKIVVKKVNVIEYEIEK